MEPEIQVSPALSLQALPGVFGIRTRQIAILVDHGVQRTSIAAIHAATMAEGAVVHFVGPRIGRFVADDGLEIEANKSMENSPSVLFDALVLPDGDEAIKSLAQDEHTLAYVQDQFRHCKPILALGASLELLELAGIPTAAGNTSGLILAEAGKAKQVAADFIAAIAAHRHPSRDCSLPMI